MADYPDIKITIHDLDGAVEHAVNRVNEQHEERFHDWMREEIDNQLCNVDFSSTISDYIDYNYDLVTEEDVVNIIRHYCDDEGYVSNTDSATSDEVDDLRVIIRELRGVITALDTNMMAMQAELDFLHEKHVENVDGRLSERIYRVCNALFTLPSRLWARVSRSN